MMHGPGRRIRKARDYLIEIDSRIVCKTCMYCGMVPLTEREAKIELELLKKGRR